MITAHFYDEETGLLSRKVFRTSSPNADEVIAANTPVGHRPVTAVTDRESQRVDLDVVRQIDQLKAQRELIEGLDDPALAEMDAELAALVGRIVVTDATLGEANRRRRDVERRRSDAMQSIEALERRQARRVRELLAASDPQLKAIDDEIAELRAVLSETDTSGRAD